MFKSPISRVSSGILNLDIFSLSTDFQVCRRRFIIILHLWLKMTNKKFPHPYALHNFTITSKYNIALITLLLSILLSRSAHYLSAVSLCQLLPSSHGQWIQTEFCFLAAQFECTKRLHNKRSSFTAIILDGTIFIEKHLV